MKPRRPFLLWLVCFIYLLAALSQLLQTIRVVNSWNLLIAVQYQPGPFYPLFSGVFFFLMSLASALLLWLLVDWSAAFATLSTALFTAWYWVDKFLVAVNPQPFTDQVFNMIVYTVILALILASLWMLRPALKAVK